MKKLLYYTLLTLCIALLALSLCSCAGNGEPEPEPAEPQSIPDIESIVEPVAGDDAPAGSELESEPEAVYSGETDEAQALTAEPPEPVITAADPPASPEPEAGAAAKAEDAAPERLEALASDIRLDSEAIEKELLRLINALRDEEGVSALGIEDAMLFAARIRAAEAFESFSHTRPDKTPYNTAFDESGFSYAGKWHGENLSSLSCPPGSLNEEEIALRMFNGLKDSPGHYRNMTEKNFVQAGIGVAVTYADGNIDITSAQLFSSL